MARDDYNKSNIEQFVIDATGATAANASELIQTLWRGYGEIVRVAVEGTDTLSIIVKHIHATQTLDNKRAAVGTRDGSTSSTRSHKRKLRSYAVETQWYRNAGTHCTDHWPIARCYGTAETANGQFIALEDLDAAGYPRRKSRLSRQEVSTCLRWLANFHGTFLGSSPAGLWKTGTYWHLGTRPDEFAAMPDSELKKVAKLVDEKLNNCRFTTLVHGDAKTANFCFSVDGKRVAAVDFQYVGGGCGIKDVVYFLDSCLPQTEIEASQNQLLSIYFDALERALHARNVSIEFADLKSEWTNLFAFAWVDFYRFLAGWAPQYARLESYTKRQLNRVVTELGSLP